MSVSTNPNLLGASDYVYNTTAAKREGRFSQALEIV